MTVFYLVNTQAFFNMPIDVIIWYMHGSKLTPINPRPYLLCITTTLKITLTLLMVEHVGRSYNLVTTKCQVNTSRSCNY
jgi:hypothetical protein